MKEHTELEIRDNWEHMRAAARLASTLFVAIVLLSSIFLMAYGDTLCTELSALSIMFLLMATWFSVDALSSALSRASTEGFGRTNGIIRLFDSLSGLCLVAALGEFARFQ